MRTIVDGRLMDLLRFDIGDSGQQVGFVLNILRGQGSAHIGLLLWHRRFTLHLATMTASLRGIRASR